ncbi:MAG TPA: septum formation initiator family protein [Candidatus Polarisedimenticolaceae bacterium]|nr:septum formation initiator family protein [Candidatus Polarisedimenticolaceae bacterium]
MRWPRYRFRRPVEPTVPVFDTDARRSDAPRPPGRPDPESLRAEKLKRRVRILAFHVVFVSGLLAALVGQGGYLELVRKRAERDAAERRLVEQQRRVDALAERIRRLEHDPMARERIAREQLGLARPGEVQFLLPREPVLPLGEPQTPGPDVAD